jgi:hypothetical protein
MGIEDFEKRQSGGEGGKPKGFAGLPQQRQTATAESMIQTPHRYGR